jgi:hypothetical protein
MIARRLVSLGIAATLLAAGCGDDDSDEQVAQPPATTPTVAQPTAPAPTATAPTPTATAPAAKAPEPTPAAPTPEPNECTTAKAISRLKFEGVDCDGAATLADAWNKAQNRCSTIDDPSSPEGYNRTCALQGYTCRAKRDVRSDARFVACAKGAEQVRFTWAPP